jgi:hypothetical protein
VPDDVIRALGDGDHGLGHAVLHQTFGGHPINGPHISADVVREIGHGDLKAGHKVLQKFVMKLRAKRARDAKGSHQR